MADPKNNEDLSEDELDQIIADMSKEEEVPAASPSPKASVLSLAPEMGANAKEKGQVLSLELSGVINLKLNFSNGEKSIELICSEDSLVCRMADGTEFRIPTGSSHPSKRNAA